MKTVVCLLAVAVLAASCGGTGNKLYSRDKTQSCFASAGVRIGGGLDFVATTSTGGAFRAHFPDNDVTVVFGETTADADNINQAYHRFHSENVGIDDVLRQQGNAVMLWHQHPSDADLNRVTGCLK